MANRRCRWLIALVVVLALTSALPLASATAAASLSSPFRTDGTVRTDGLTSGSGFTSLAPMRVLDTRIGLGAPTGPVGPGGTIVLDLSGRVPMTATAVVLNLTGTAPTAGTFVTIYPDGATRPLASNLNLVAGETRPNLVTVGVGGTRRIALYNNSGSTHLIADLAGFYATDSAPRFSAQPPLRLLDTRTAGAAVGPGGTIVLDLSDRVPASATAVTLNLTGTGATAPTFVTAWPTGTPRPTASNLNLVAGQTAPNLVTVALGAGRTLSLFNNAGQTHLIADLAGFYTPDYGALFTPAPSPTRVLDTRAGVGAPARPVGPRATIDVTLGAGLPAWTTGAVLNVTGTKATAGTFVTVWPPGQNQPLASNLNLVAGQTAPNLVAIGVGPLGAISLYNNSGYVDLIADLAGWFELPDVPCAGGCVYAWGLNNTGQLGTGTTDVTAAEPRRVWGLSRAVAVAGGFRNAYALRVNGTVVAWGDNGFGQLGNGWHVGRSPVPVPVLGLDDVTAIAAGEAFGIALRADGTVWEWGDMGPGVPPQKVPVLVPGLAGVTRIAAGWNSAYAVLGDGSLVAWRSNQYGQLGNGSAEPWVPNPVPVTGLTGVVDVSGGRVTAHAVTSDSTAWAWGLNNYGQFGNGAMCDPPSTGVCSSRVPVATPPDLSGFTRITGDAQRVFAVLDNGSAWAWGSNDRGGLGNGEDCTDCESLPAPIFGLTGVSGIAGNGFGGYALLVDGTVRAWGDNTLGQLGGAGGGEYSTVPLELPLPAGVAAVSAGWGTGFALTP